MAQRSYEDAADEFDAFSFVQAVGEFSRTFVESSLGELMALRSRFVQLAYGAELSEADERRTCAVLEIALDKVLVYRMRGNPSGLRSYLQAKDEELLAYRDGRDV